MASIKVSSAIAAAGTSIIAPSCTCSAMAWPSRRSCAAMRLRWRRIAMISSRALIIGSSTRTGP